jgi:hypothetical protein
VQNNLIYGNQAYGIQVAGYVNMGSVLITNNTIVAQKNFGSIVVWQPGAKGCIIQNNIMMGNRTYGVDFFSDGGGHIIRNNNFFNNGFGAVNPAKSSQYTASNNVASDPMLGSNYAPLPASPLVNAGYVGQDPNYDITGAVRLSATDTIGCFH